MTAHHSLRQYCPGRLSVGRVNDIQLKNFSRARVVNVNCQIPLVLLCYKMYTFVLISLALA